MTTGRINQVTILRPARAARQPAGTRRPQDSLGARKVLLQGRECLRTVAQTPSPGRRASEACRQPPMDHPIAPTEFPKERSAVDAAERLESRLQFTACALLVEGTHPLSTPGGGYRFGPTPKDLAWVMASSQSPTDPKGARWHAPTGLRLSCASAEQGCC